MQVLLVGTRPASAASLEEVGRAVSAAETPTTIFLQLSGDAMGRQMAAAAKADKENQVLCGLHLQAKHSGRDWKAAVAHDQQ